MKSKYYEISQIHWFLKELVNIYHNLADLYEIIFSHQATPLWISPIKNIYVNPVSLNGWLLFVRTFMSSNAAVILSSSEMFAKTLLAISFIALPTPNLYPSYFMCKIRAYIILYDTTPFPIYLEWSLNYQSKSILIPWYCNTFPRMGEQSYISCMYSLKHQQEQNWSSIP